MHPDNTDSRFLRNLFAYSQKQFSSLLTENTLCRSQSINKTRKYNGRQTLKFTVALPSHSEKYLSSLINLTMLVSPSSVIISSFHIRCYITYGRQEKWTYKEVDNAPQIFIGPKTSSYNKTKNISKGFLNFYFCTVYFDITKILITNKCTPSLHL